MQTKHANPQTGKLGEAIAAAYETSRAVAPDRATANELAARHLERVLVRGANVHIIGALRRLAREFAPHRSRAVRGEVHAKAWAPQPLVVAR